MNRRNLFAAITVSLVGLGALSVRFAEAQSSPPPLDPSEVLFVPFTVQTSEPATGFTGACLAPYVTYSPQLPTVCYLPKAPLVDPDAGTLRLGATRFVVPAAKVVRSYSQNGQNYDSYQALVTCFPHDSSGNCPQLSYAISKSCCNLGTNLISIDGKSAEGIVPLGF
jgi:hypothetical protein